MLVDITLRELDEREAALHMALGESLPHRIATGVYEGGLNFHYQIAEDYEQYPEEVYIQYGVCDSWEQALEYNRRVLENPNKKYVILVTPIRKSEQPPQGGWRWHKWGTYIGTKEPEAEYLVNEPEIDLVYVYRIHRIEPPGLKVLPENESLYTHFKGGVYEVDFVARNSVKCDELLVIYHEASLPKTGEHWARPLREFNEEVEVDGKMVKRFTKKEIPKRRFSEFDEL